MTLAPPAIPVFPAGYGPLPADFNGWVENPFGFLTTGIVFRAERHASQAVTGGSVTPIQYDTIQEDPYSGWNSGTFEWVAPFTGWYEVTVQTCYAVAANALTAAARVTGSALYILEEIQNNGAASMFGGCAGAVTVFMVGGADYVQGIAFTANTTALRSTIGSFSSLEISYVSQ